MKTPWWFIVLLILAAAPALALESVAAKSISQNGWLASDTMTWLYPAYVIISAVSAWICYPDRRTLAWVLFFLVVLTDMFLILAMAVL